MTRLEDLQATRASTYAALCAASNEASALRRRLSADHPDRRDAEGRVEIARKAWDATVAAYVDAMLHEGAEPPPRRTRKASAQADLFAVVADPSMPPGVFEIRQDARTLGRFVAEDEGATS